MSRLLIVPFLLLLTSQITASTTDDVHEKLDAWDITSATTQAKQLLWQDPENRHVQLLAARVQHQRGQYKSAMSLIHATQDPLSKSVQDLADRTSGSLRWMAESKEIRTPHFIIRFLGKDEITAFYAGNVLEAALRNIGRELGYQHAESDEPILVEFYPDAFGLADATGLTIREIQTTGTIAICKYHRVMITSPLAASAGYGWADTLAHELTHLIIAKASNNHVPIWLHEGIAKYFETTWRGKPGEALEPYGEKLLRRAVEKNSYVTFAEMHPSMAKLPSQEKAALAFAEVFSVLEFIQARFPHDKVGLLLRHLASSNDLDASLKATLGLSLNGLETAWHGYLKTRHFRDVAGAKPSQIRFTDGATNTTDASPLEDLVDLEAKDAARLGELLQLRGHHHSAMRKYEKAYAKVDARYPTLNHRLAHAYLNVGNEEKARQIIDASLKIHSQDADALLLAGQIEQRAGKTDEAIARFEALRWINPYIPALHEALALLYAKSGKPTSQITREQHFAQLAKTPMPPTQPLRADLKPTPGSAGISFLQIDWQPISIDGQPPQETPLWNQTLTPGKHNVSTTALDGTSTTQEIFVTSHPQIIRLD